MATLSRTRNKKVRKNRNSRKGGSVNLKSLPNELLLEVIAKVALNSFDDLCRMRQSCKEINKAGQDDYVFQHVSLDKFRFNPLRKRKRYLELLRSCGKCGNAEALYRQGVLELFNLKEFDFESGFECLKKAAARGHREATYVHVLSRELVRLGMVLLDYLPMNIVDSYGDLPSYGISPPVEGPFFFETLTGKTHVFSGVKTIRHNIVEFKNGSIQRVDAIVMATGNRSVAHKWLKVILDENDKPKNKYPEHWKGEKGVYCVGFSGKGIPGISFDTMDVANDIHQILLVKTGNAAREV
ncbi:hypothetical protein ACLB2K_042090 [Fragaria x ananassa]